MRFRYSWRATLICGALALLMVRASFWQWQRYLEKQQYIETLRVRLEQPVVDLEGLLEEVTSSHSAEPWNDFIHRRVRVRGEYDHQHEVALRNRRYQEISGVHLITPLRLSLDRQAQPPKEPIVVLVNRGFVPLSKAAPSERTGLREDREVAFVGLIKQGAERRLFAPADPPAGAGHPWVDQWLRVDIAAMKQQLPYQVLPVYLEIMQIEDRQAVEEQMLATMSGKDEMLFLGSGKLPISQIGAEPQLSYPVPIFDTVIPPGRHLGYVFEWACMALATVAIGLVLQLRRDRPVPKDATLS